MLSRRCIMSLPAPSSTGMAKVRQPGYARGQLIEGCSDNIDARSTGAPIACLNSHALIIFRVASAYFTVRVQA
jgi:hypothetical protein